MNFSPRDASRRPEINLIPFIDVLLVILIFLMLTTTYSKFTELQLTLPTADAEQQRDRPKEVIVTVAADGRYAVNKSRCRGRGGRAPSPRLCRQAPGRPAARSSSSAPMPCPAPVGHRRDGSGAAGRA